MVMIGCEQGTLPNGDALLMQMSYMAVKFFKCLLACVSFINIHHIHHRLLIVGVQYQYNKIAYHGM